MKMLSKFLFISFTGMLLFNVRTPKSKDLGMANLKSKLRLSLRNSWLIYSYLELTNKSTT